MFHRLRKVLFQIHNRMTPQYLQLPMSYDLVEPWDVQVDWHDEAYPLSNILLNFIYGAAVAKWWKCDYLHGMLEEKFTVDFNQVQLWWKTQNIMFLKKIPKRIQVIQVILPIEHIQEVNRK